MPEDTLTKSAILMLALGSDEAAEIMKYLTPKEVQKLGTTMAGLKAVPKDDVDSAIYDFLREIEKSSDFGLDSDDFIRDVMNKALGEDKASNILNKILTNTDSSGIESLKWMDAETVAEFVKHEHPQIIATILVYLDPDQSAEIVTHFTDRLKQDVMLRIATLDGVKPVAIQELNDVMDKMLSNNENVKKQSMGGIETAAEIMNFINGDNETVIMDGISSHDEFMAQAIMDKMFVFDDVVQMDDRAIQTILREVQSDTLITAMKAASDELKEKIFKNMSSRAADMMREDLEASGPMKLSDVEAQQKEILNIVRRLADEGQIQMPGRGGEDEYV